MKKRLPCSKEMPSFKLIVGSKKVIKNFLYLSRYLRTDWTNRFRLVFALYDIIKSLPIAVGRDQRMSYETRDCPICLQPLPTPTIPKIREFLLFIHLL